MRIHVVAEPAEQFNAWLQGQRQPAAAGAMRGQQVLLENTCVNCHAIQGTPANARVGPDLSHLGSGVVANTPVNLLRWVANPHDVKPGVLMPAYGSLSPDDLDALVAYLEGLK